MPELSDLPVETLRLIAERCEFRPRFNLRSASKLMKEVVDQSKLVLDEVRMDIWNPESRDVSFEFTNPDGNVTCHEIEMGIENADSMERSAKWISSIFKNAEIECINIQVNQPDFIEKVKEHLKSPFKAREISSESDPFWICDKSYVQRLTCGEKDPKFFHMYLDTINNLDEVELTETMNIKDQDVLSMKATQIYLISENFSAETVNQLMAKFTARDLIDSEFRLENPKGNFISKIKIPDGFSSPTKIEGLHEKIDGNKKTELKVKNDSVRFEIISLRNNIDDGSDDNSSDSDSDHNDE